MFLLKIFTEASKLRNDNFDQWDVRKDQIKSDDLIQRVEQIKTDDSLMQFPECVSNPKNKKRSSKVRSYFIFFSQNLSRSSLQRFEF